MQRSQGIGIERFGSVDGHRSRLDLSRRTNGRRRAHAESSARLFFSAIHGCFSCLQYQ